MQISPYLFFDGRCEEAIAFYKKTLGAELSMLMRYKENPDKPVPSHVSPELDDKVMHASLRIGDTEVMLSDGLGQGKPEFKGMALTYSAPTATEADRIFNALAKGGQIQMPIGKTFFSPRFGMVADKFGLAWMIIVQPPAEPKADKKPAKPAAKAAGSARKPKSK